MSRIPNVVVFAGSAREDSFNKKLARLAAAMARDAGANASFLDLRDHPMPLMDEDLEARHGEPAGATSFKNALKACDAFIIATPEHNGTFPALLKNALDWASRRRAGEARMACFAGKTAAILSASPGQLGGLRAANSLRPQLSHLGTIVIPDQYAVAAAHEAFDADGSLKDPAKADAVRGVVKKLVETTTRLIG